MKTECRLMVLVSCCTQFWRSRSTNDFWTKFYQHSIPVAAPSKVWVCGHSLAGIVGSNHAWAWMSVSCECFVLYSSRSLRWADPSFRVVLPSVYVPLSVIRCNNSTLHLQWVGRSVPTLKEITNYKFLKFNLLCKVEHRNSRLLFWGMRIMDTH